MLCISSKKCVTGCFTVVVRREKINNFIEGIKSQSANAIKSTLN